MLIKSSTLPTITAIKRPIHCCIGFANIAGTGWLNFSIITGVAEIRNRDVEEIAALLLNNVVVVDEQDIHNCMKHNTQHGVKYVVLFANVGKMKKNDVFISSPGNPGNHWTLLYVDLTVNKWKNLKKNDLEDVIDYLKKQPVLKTYLTTEDDYMADIYAHFPAILLLDATYKLLDLRMPVYLLKDLVR
ncbi:hypothetical protein ACROYT_G014045 [Oculina patagonica]